MDFQQFGEQLRDLRKRAGFSQMQLADKLEDLSQSASSHTHRVVDASLISKWERAKKRNNRPWKPTHQYMVYLIRLFADQLDLEQARSWAAQAGYQISEVILQETFTQPEVAQPQAAAPTASLPRPMQHPPLPDSYVHRPQLEATIHEQFQTQQTVVLQGLGGSGKSTLAVCVADQLAVSFSDGVIWVDDCQRADGTYQVTMAQDRIAAAFQVTLKGQTLAERAAQLRSLMWGKQCLIVLDDVWDSPDLEHLRVHREPSRLLITTRQSIIAYTFGCPAALEIGGLSPAEGQNLLGPALLAQPPAPTDHPGQVADLFNTVEGEGRALLERVGYLPLGVGLIRALLQSGYTATTLLRHFDETPTDTSPLELGLTQTRLHSLNTCFDLSYNALPTDEVRRYFAQLSCFSSNIRLEALPRVWQTEPQRAGLVLQQLTEYTLLHREADRFRLHPLLRYYARQKFSSDWPGWIESSYQDYTTFLLKHVLYHPQLLSEVPTTAPDLDPYWSDIVACISWATEHAPHLTAWAVLLAHTERPALLEAVGQPLLDALATYIPTADPELAQPILLEQFGTLQLLQHELDTAYQTFGQAATQLKAAQSRPAQVRLLLRQAGIHLLQENLSSGAALARQAQAQLAETLPLSNVDLPAVRQLFYWFNMVYLALARWEALPQEDVSHLADLAQQINDPHIVARGLHIYRVWCTTPTVERPSKIRAKGRELSTQVVAAWQACGEPDKAKGEALWTTYALTGEISPQAAESYARRISASTPSVSLNQQQIIDSPGIRWWLQSPEEARIQRLAALLPPYFKATNSATAWLEAESEEWLMVRDVIGIQGALAKTSRRFVLTNDHLTEGHYLNRPEWSVFSGQKMLPITDHRDKQFIEQILSQLDTT